MFIFTSVKALTEHLESDAQRRFERSENPDLKLLIKDKVALKQQAATIREVIMMIENSNLIDLEPSQDSLPKFMQTVPEGGA